MPDPVDDVPYSCEYECYNGQYVLIGGSAPPGYTCPLILGTCSIPGDILFGQPVPIPVPVLDDPPGIAREAGVAATASMESNSATYTYDGRSGILYFSSGKADKGYGFFSTLTTEQLRSNYPSIAEKVSGMTSSTSFQMILPALPASIVGRRDESSEV